MTLKDFEENISATLLERGFDYFVNERVDNLDKVAPGLWIAEVHGSEIYTVEVNTHRTKIKDWDCDCPYDGGPVCKHVIATFYALAETMELEKSQSGKKQKKKKDKIGEIFKSTSKEDLQQFIISQFRRNRNLKNAFIAHFAELLHEDSEEKYRTIVRNIYKAAQGRDGFIDYYASRTITDPLFELIQKAEELLVKKDILEALAISKTLIEEIPVFIQNMDDSDGGAGTIIDQAFETFYKIAEQAPPLLKDELFTYCISEYPKEKYHGFGFEDYFLHLLPSLTTTEEQEKLFFDLINRQIETEKGKSFSDYSIVQLISAKINYLEQAKRKEEAQALVKTNNHYPEFRRILINQAIDERDFNTAKELCREGIVIAEDKLHWGIMNEWHVKLLGIAEMEKNIPEIRRLSEKLYFDNYFSMDYFKKLKSTYTKSEWPERCEELINKLKGEGQSGGYGEANALAQIFIEEDYKDRLLKLLQLNSNDISFVDTYANHLQDQFPGEVLTLYEKGVKILAQNTGRKFYTQVAKLLRKMKKIKGGTEEVNSLIQQFRQMYKNRRAMMEILNDNFPETIPSPKGKDVQKTINKNLRLL